MHITPSTCEGDELKHMFELANITPKKIVIVALVAIGLVGGALAGAGAVAISLATITATSIVVGALVGAGIGLAFMATAAKIVYLVKGSFKNTSSETLFDNSAPTKLCEIIHTDSSSNKNKLENFLGENPLKKTCEWVLFPTDVEVDFETKIILVEYLIQLNKDFENNSKYKIETFKNKDLDFIFDENKNKSQIEQFAGIKF